MHAHYRHSGSASVMNEDCHGFPLSGSRYLSNYVLYNVQRHILYNDISMKIVERATGFNRSSHTTTVELTADSAADC